MLSRYLSNSIFTMNIAMFRVEYEASILALEERVISMGEESIPFNGTSTL